MLVSLEHQKTLHAFISEFIIFIKNVEKIIFQNENFDGQNLHFSVC